jgi:hypothetical protein
MQVSPKYPHKVSIKNHPNYRVVKVSDRQDPVGFVLPYANLVVPDKQVIRDLKDIIQLYQALKPDPFNYGSSSGYRKHSELPPLSEEPIEMNRISDLPLFKKS